MQNSDIIKKLQSWPVILAASLLIVFGSFAIKLQPRTVPFYKCSEAYRTYACNPSIDAAFIKDFPINDTLTADVTLLNAKDSAGWEQLKTDFDIKNPTPSMLEKIRNGEDVISTKLIMVNEEDFIGAIAVSRLNNTLTIFHINTDEELHAIMQYNHPPLKLKS